MKLKFTVKTFYHPIEWMFSGKYVLLSTAIIELDNLTMNIDTKFEDDNLKECLKDTNYRNAMYNSLVIFHSDFSDIEKISKYVYFDKISIKETLKKHFDNMTYKSCQTLVFTIED